MPEEQEAVVRFKLGSLLTILIAIGTVLTAFVTGIAFVVSFWHDYQELRWKVRDQRNWYYATQYPEEEWSVEWRKNHRKFGIQEEEEPNPK